MVAGAVAARIKRRPSETGAQLLLRKGAAAEVITGIVGETGATAVYWNDIAQAPHRAIAKQLATSLNEIGVVTEISDGDLLGDPNRDPQQGRARPAGVHAVLQARPDKGRSAKTPARPARAEWIS